MGEPSDRPFPALWIPSVMTNGKRSPARADTEIKDADKIAMRAMAVLVEFKRFFISNSYGAYRLKMELS
jgi:hypothetical protein